MGHGRTETKPMNLDETGMKAATYQKEEFRKVADVLRNGGVAVFPTDTTYVLGASIKHPKALERAFDMKERPKDHSLPLLISRPEVALEIAMLQERDLAILEKVWPGPFTLILRTKLRLPAGLVGPDGTVALRCPNHGIALELLRSVGDTLAVTSANATGEGSPVKFGDVAPEILEAADAALDAGVCPLAGGTAILKVAGRGPQLIREGCVAPPEIERVVALLKQIGR